MDVYTKTQVDNILGEYALSSALNSYATTTDLSSKANSVDVFTKTQINTTLGDYALTSALNSYAL